MLGGAAMLMVGGISAVFILQRVKSEGGSSRVLEVSFSGQVRLSFSLESIFVNCWVVVLL
jgi:hypothetical protein